MLVVGRGPTNREDDPRCLCSSHLAAEVEGVAVERGGKPMSSTRLCKTAFPLSAKVRAQQPRSSYITAPQLHSPAPQLCSTNSTPSSRGRGA